MVGFDFFDTHWLGHFPKAERSTPPPKSMYHSLNGGEDYMEYLERRLSEGLAVPIEYLRNDRALPSTNITCNYENMTFRYHMDLSHVPTVER